jgi:hypothetical protein
MYIMSLTWATPGNASPHPTPPICCHKILTRWKMPKIRKRRERDVIHPAAVEGDGTTNERYCNVVNVRVGSLTVPLLCCDLNSLHCK